MSRGAVLSIVGLYNNDDSVFDLMEFPDGFTTEQKQNVIDNIMVECAEFELLYPNPTVMKNIIGIWSRKELPYWNRVYAAAQLEYNPIENYRRNESEAITDDNTEEHSGTDENTASGSDSNTASANNTETNSGTDTTTGKIAGFDSGDLVDKEQNDLLHGHVVQDYSGSNSSTTYGRKDSLKHGEKIDTDNHRERHVLAYGNIGVTTSQDMLTQEMEIAKIIQVVPIIIESFKERFCLMVY